MNRRKYSVREIDTMRSCVRVIAGDQGFRDDAEDWLRTYMLNGTTVEELEDAASESMKRFNDRLLDAMYDDEGQRRKKWWRHFAFS